MKDGRPELRIGTAGWSVPPRVADAFPGEGTGLQRYAGCFDCAEINSSFHRSHKPDTWARWRDAVPSDFRFSCKLSKEITHARRLVDCGELLEAALTEMRQLGDRFEVLLVQLPPSLAFDADVARAFLGQLRGLWEGGLAFEPRDASWFEAEADALLVEHRAARVAADPARVPAGAEPGGWPGLIYYRLHGSPVAYRSSYDDGRLEAYADRLRGLTAPAWCIFDNTASSAATGDALALSRLLGED